MVKDTESIILETAKDHFMRKGFAATRMQEIADQAEINKALLHYYFRSKDKLYEEVIEKMFGEFFPMFSKAMGGPGTFLERSEVLVDTYLKTFIANPHIPMFIMSEISQKKENFVHAIKKHKTHFQGIQSYLSQMQEEMDKRIIKRIEPFQLFMNIMGMTIFPFAAKPIISTILEVSDKQFQALMLDRKKVIMDFIISATKI